MRNLILVLSFLWATSLSAQTVTIQNPSFETTSTLSTYNCSGAQGDGSPYQENLAGPIPGWTATGSGYFGSMQPNVGHCLFFTALADGMTYAFTNGPTLTQDLGVTAVPNATYTLTVYVGHRQDCCTGVATIQLFAGATSLCSLTVDSSTLTAGVFTKETLSCPTNGTPPSGDLVISLAHSGAQSQFDNVSLTYTQSHSAVLTWTDSINPSGTQYNVYRTPGSPTGSPITCNNFVKLNGNPVNALTYTDATIASGQSYCWEVRAIIGSSESIAGDSLFLVVQ